MLLIKTVICEVVKRRVDVAESLAGCSDHCYKQLPARGQVTGVPPPLLLSSKPVCVLDLSRVESIVAERVL